MQVRIASLTSAGFRLDSFLARSTKADLAAAFENVVDLGQQQIPIGAGGQRKYNLWRGENLLSWPEWK